MNPPYAVLNDANLTKVPDLALDTMQPVAEHSWDIIGSAIWIGGGGVGLLLVIVVVVLLLRR